MKGARAINLLNARFAATVTELGRHADGGGLNLLVRKRGERVERLWIFRYCRGPRGDARERTLSLGPARDISLAAARHLAAQCRELLATGGDPRNALERRNASAADAASNVTSIADARRRR